MHLETLRAVEKQHLLCWSISAAAILQLFFGALCGASMCLYMRIFLYVALHNYLHIHGYMYI